MRIAKVIGNVTLNRAHPALQGGRFPLVVALTLDNLTGASDAESEPFAVYDDLGAGLGSVIAVSEGGEAAQPFAPNYKPIDAYNAAILDEWRVESLPGAPVPTPPPADKPKRTPPKAEKPKATKPPAAKPKPPARRGSDKPKQRDLFE